MRKKAIFLFLLGFFGFLFASGSTASNPAYQRYFDRELITLKSSTLQHIKRLEGEIRLDTQSLTQARNQIIKLEEQNRQLAQSKSFFNRNESRIKKNQQTLQKLTLETNASQTKLSKKTLEIQKHKRLLSGLTQELELRKTQAQYRLTRNLETYETPQLIETIEAYGQILVREKAQLLYYQQQLAKRGDQFDDTALKLQKIVDQLRKQAEATAFSFHTIQGEITRRKEDQSYEKEQIAAKAERKELTELQSSKLDRQKGAKNPSSLLSFIDNQKEEEIELRKQNEEQKLLIYFVLSVLLFLAIIIWVKRTFTTKASYGRYRSAAKPRAKLRMKR